MYYDRLLEDIHLEMSKRSARALSSGEKKVIFACSQQGKPWSKSDKSVKM
jgi:hypothetical protein